MTKRKTKAAPMDRDEHDYEEEGYTPSKRGKSKRAPALDQVIERAAARAVLEVVTHLGEEADEEEMDEALADLYELIETMAGDVSRPPVKWTYGRLKQVAK